jgi:hypothetical protein
MKAFPVISNGIHDEGMDLRDYFAAKAMQSLILDDEVDEQAKEANFGKNEWCEFVAFCSYKFANAMMRARSKHE